MVYVKRVQWCPVQILRLSPTQRVFQADPGNVGPDRLSTQPSQSDPHCAASSRTVQRGRKAMESSPGPASAPRKSGVMIQSPSEVLQVRQRAASGESLPSRQQTRRTGNIVDHEASSRIRRTASTEKMQGSSFRKTSVQQLPDYKSVREERLRKKGSRDVLQGKRVGFDDDPQASSASKLSGRTKSVGHSLRRDGSTNAIPSLGSSKSLNLSHNDATSLRVSERVANCFQMTRVPCSTHSMRSLLTLANECPSAKEEKPSPDRTGWREAAGAPHGKPGIATSVRSFARLVIRSLLVPRRWRSSQHWKPVRHS